MIYRRGSQLGHQEIMALTVPHWSKTTRSNCPVAQQHHRWRLEVVWLLARLLAIRRNWIVTNIRLILIRQLIS